MRVPSLPEKARARIRVACLQPADAAALACFFSSAWNSPQDSESETRARTAIENSSPFDEQVTAPTVAVFDQQRIVGHLTTIPTELSVSEQSLPGVWFKGFMVLPDYRNGPVGFMLAKEMVKHVDVSLVVTVTDAARRLFEAVGFRKVGMLDNFLSVTSPVRFLRSLDISKLGLSGLPAPVKFLAQACRWPPVAVVAGALVAMVNGVVDFFLAIRARGVKTTQSLALPDPIALEGLWQRVREAVMFVPSRSAAYLKWRYARDNAKGYEFLVAKKGNELVGLAVVRRPRRVDDPRLSGLMIGQVVDLLFEPTDVRTLDALLVSARQWARGAGCDAILLTATHKSVSQKMLWRVYARIPPNIHFLMRPGRHLAEVPASMGECWITRGDAWGDDI